MKEIMIMLLLSISFLSFKGNDVHPIYISLAEVEYSTDKKEIQVALKIFTDDLELAIRKNGVVLNLDSGKEIENADDYVEVYVGKKFKILTGNQDIIGEFDYLGKEYEEASTWIYFSFPVYDDLEVVEVLNTVIIDVYDEQVNIINFRKDRELIKTSSLNKKTKSVIIDLE